MKNLRILDPKYPKGRITHALFDFDGTISLIRYGWQEVMQELMEEAIAGTREEAGPGLRREISRYIDESTGILTIRQMQWLEDAVRRWKMNDVVFTAKKYKARYNQRLLDRKVKRRVDLLGSDGERERFLVKGVVDFLDLLKERGTKLFLASGTDDVYVRREASLLGVDGFFEGRIFGALDDTEEYTKENIIRRVLAEELSGDRADIMMVAGDGPVEVRAAKDYGAVALGVASDEAAGCGWNERKADRLTAAGADILIPDFSEAGPLVALIGGG